PRTPGARARRVGRPGLHRADRPGPGAVPGPGIGAARLDRQPRAVGPGRLGRPAADGHVLPVAADLPGDGTLPQAHRALAAPADSRSRSAERRVGEGWWWERAVE